MNKSIRHIPESKRLRCPTTDYFHCGKWDVLMGLYSVWHLGKRRDTRKEVRKDALPFRIDHQPQDGIVGLCYEHKLKVMWTIRSVTRFSYPMYTKPRKSITWLIRQFTLHMIEDVKGHTRCLISVIWGVQLNID